MAEHVLSPAILDHSTTGAFTASLKKIVVASYNHFRLVDMVSVGMQAADSLSELLDSLVGLVRVLGAWSDVVRYKNEVLGLAETTGKDGSKASVVIASGSQSPAALVAKLEAIVAGATTLEIALPFAYEIYVGFGGGWDRDVCEAIDGGGRFTRDLHGVL